MVRKVFPHLRKGAKMSALVLLGSISKAANISHADSWKVNLDVLQPNSTSWIGMMENQLLQVAMVPNNNNSIMPFIHFMAAWIREVFTDGLPQRAKTCVRSNQSADRIAVTPLSPLLPMPWCGYIVWEKREKSTTLFIFDYYLRFLVKQSRENFSYKLSTSISGKCSKLGDVVQQIKSH